MSEIGNSESEFQSDVEWQAFLYVTDEMSDDEATQFEDRMTNDVEICRAVADATILLSALTSGEFQQGTPARPAGAERDCVPIDQLSIHGQKPNTRSGGVFAAAVCLACLLFVGLAVFKSGKHGHEIASSEKSSATELVSAWASGSYREVESTSVDASMSELLEDDGIAHGLELEVPTWMLMAVEDTEAAPKESENGSEKL